MKGWPYPRRATASFPSCSYARAGSPRKNVSHPRLRSREGTGTPEPGPRKIAPPPRSRLESAPRNSLQPSGVGTPHPAPHPPPPLARKHFRPDSPEIVSCRGICDQETISGDFRPRVVALVTKWWPRSGDGGGNPHGGAKDGDLGHQVVAKVRCLPKLFSAGEFATRKQFREIFAQV